MSRLPSSKHPASAPEVSQSLLRVLKNNYDRYFQGHGRELCSVLIIICLFGAYILHKNPIGQSTSADQNFSQTDIAEATNQIALIDSPTLENDYLINPLSHTRWKRYIVAPGDTFTQVLKKAGLSKAAWQEIMSLGTEAKLISRVSPGQVFNIDSQNGVLIALSQSLDPVRTLYILRQKNGLLHSFIHEKEQQTRVAYGSANIEDSFFLSGKRANIDDNIMKQLAEIFGCVIDFAHDVHANDSFKVLYEEQFVEGEKIGTGHILAVEFNNNGKTHQAIRYTDPKGKVGYFTPNGMSFKRTFLRTPVKFSRISSYFNHQRRHPILHNIRAHKGVDYVAPTGTPVKAVADGVISFQGRKGGYGKTVILEHDAKHSTLYAHLSGFAKSTGSTRRVTQGQVIGYVGSSGLATGPHLHYEFRINGVHHNPLNTPFSHPVPIPVEQHQAFFSQASQLMGLLDYHDKIMMASNEY
jgi:murein DD-endopeptidase MepM/ murein hydrolase activator NlpD